MGDLAISKIILIFMPFIFFTFIASYSYLSAKSEASKLSAMITSSTVSAAEKHITRLQNEDEKKTKATFIEKQNNVIKLLGLDYKFENLLGIAFVLFIIGALISHLLFKAGPLLMIYLGIVAGSSVFVYLNNLLKKRHKILTIEFLEKMRDVASYLSVGKTLNSAIKEACTAGNISAVMARELEIVSQDIFTGKKTADAFMDMYNRIQIEEIKIYANTLSTFESSGGNLIQIMKVNDKFATHKLEIKNEQNIYAESQKASQKIIVGIPLAMIVFFFIFNPSFFGDFYGTLIGQIIAIVAITMLLAGIYLSNKLVSF